MTSRLSKRGGGRKGKGKGMNGAGGISTSSTNGAQLSQVVERWMPFTPPKRRLTLRYCDTIALTSTSGAVATWVIRANDLFDPDLTGTGHQPMGFDPMMLFYNHFCVLKAKLTCTFQSTSGAVSQGLIRYDASATPLTVIDRILELGGCVSTMMGTQGGLGSSMTIDLSLNVAKLQGVTPATILADPTLRGDAATSPTELTYFHIQLFDTGGASSGAYVTFYLEQEAVFTEPRDNVESFHRKTVNGKMVLTTEPVEEKFVVVPPVKPCACKPM